MSQKGTFLILHFALPLNFPVPVAIMGLMRRIEAWDYSQSFYSRII
jgi:hypothetical protein